MAVTCKVFVLRSEFRLGYRVSLAPAGGEKDYVASFVASMLPLPPLISEDADAKEPGELHEVPLRRRATAACSEEEASGRGAGKRLSQHVGWFASCDPQFCNKR